MSVGLGVVVVVSIGVVVDDVSSPVPDGDGIVVVVSLVMGGDEVSEPVEFSGVSQPIVAIAKKAMKRMLFMSFTLMFKNMIDASMVKKSIPFARVDTHM